MYGQKMPRSPRVIVSLMQKSGLQWPGTAICHLRVLYCYFPAWASMVAVPDDGSMDGSTSSIIDGFVSFSVYMCVCVCACRANRAVRTCACVRAGECAVNLIGLCFFARTLSISLSWPLETLRCQAVRQKRSLGMLSRKSMRTSRVL